MAIHGPIGIEAGAQNRGGAALGLGIALLIAVLATVASPWIPLIGAPVLGVVAGMALSPAGRRFSALRGGWTLASGPLLQAAVVLLGAQLSLREVLQVGESSLPVMLGTLVVCLVLAELVGRRLGIGRNLRTLIGVGTAICGASAIAAVSPVVRAKSDEIAYAVTTIFVFNVAAVLAFPPLGHLLGMSQQGFGLFAGTAVNDTSSVIAAATSFGHAAGEHAVVVKLTRTLMIIPISIGLAVSSSRSGGDRGRARVPVRVSRVVPWFLVGFVVMAAAKSAGWLPSATLHPLGTATVFLITVALVAIGLSTDFAGLRRTGVRPLLLGAGLWACVATTSLLLQMLTG